MSVNLNLELIEVLFSSGKFPIGIQPTSVPEGISEYAHVSKHKQDSAEAASPYGFPGDGNDLDPISPRSLELNYPDWRDKSGIPTVYLQKTAF